MFKLLLLTIFCFECLALYTFPNIPKNSDVKSFYFHNSLEVNKRQATCPIDDLPCASPFNYERTKQFVCNDDCPEGHLCCEDSCFVHKICKPVTKQTGYKETYIENCPAEKLSCREPFPIRQWTKFACEEGRCPTGYMCCSDSCFHFKICKKLEKLKSPAAFEKSITLENIKDIVDFKDPTAIQYHNVLSTSCTDSVHVYNLKRRQYYSQYHRVRHYHYVVDNPSPYFNPLMYYQTGSTSVYKCGNDFHCPPCHKCFYDLFCGYKVCKKWCPQDGTSTAKTTESSLTTSAVTTIPTTPETTTTEVTTTESTTTEPTTSTTTTTTELTSTTAVTTTELTSTTVDDTTTEWTTTDSITATETTATETATEVPDTTTQELTTVSITSEPSTETIFPSTTTAATTITATNAVELTTATQHIDIITPVIVTTVTQHIDTIPPVIVAVIPVDNGGSGNDDDDEDEDYDEEEESYSDGDQEADLEAEVESVKTTTASNIFSLFN